MSNDDTSLMQLLINRLPKTLADGVSSLILINGKVARCDTSKVDFAQPQPVYLIPRPNEWNFQAEYTSQQTNTLFKAATAGTSLFITDIYIGVNGAVTVTIDDADANPIFKYYGATAGDGVSKRFQTPIKMNKGKSLRVSSSSGTAFFIAVTGYDTLG